MTLRESYLEAVRQAQIPRKQLISKSAFGPQIVAVRNQAGEVIEFATAEHIPIDDPRHPLNRQVISKSAVPADDLNACLDSFFPFQPIGFQEEVSKGAELDDDPTAELMGIFPTWLQQN